MTLFWPSVKASAPAAFVIGLAVAALALAVLAVARGAPAHAASPRQAMSSRLGYPGLVLATGAGWLILKLEGDLQKLARRQARLCFLGTLVAVGIVSLWTPLMDGDIAARWFSWPNIAFLSPVPLLAALFGLLEWRAIADNKAELKPFVYAVCLFSLSYLGIAISLWPMIVPHHYTLWQAAYAELVFLPIYWPDFDRVAFAGALADYAHRERRFGGVAAPLAAKTGS